METLLAGWGCVFKAPDLKTRRRRCRGQGDADGLLVDYHLTTATASRPSWSCDGASAPTSTQS
jgi:hypothetical protein